MENLRKKLGQWDFQRTNREVGKLGDVEGVDERWILDLLALVPLMRREYPKMVRLQIAGDTFEEPQFKSIIWNTGEAIRRILKKKRSLRTKASIWRGVEEVCRNRFFGRGRESFVMLLGQYGGKDRALLLRELLSDEEVAGHALYALRLLGCPDALPEIERFLHAETTWIRNEAKKYVAKVKPDA